MKHCKLIRYRLLCVVALVGLTLSACGWQIRGSENIASNANFEGNALSVKFMQRNPALMQVLHNTVRSNQLAISSDANTKLVIERERLEKQSLAVTETGVAAQYQLILTIHYHVKTADKTLVPSNHISSWRSYDFDAKQIAAKSQEEQALLLEMREELVNRMLLAISDSEN